MPALPPVPGVLAFILNWHSGSGKVLQNRLHFAYTGGPPTSANCATMATTAVSAAATHLAGDTNPDVSMGAAEVIDLASASGAVGSGGTPWSGSRSGGPNPAGAAVVMSHSISRRYRGGKPKTFLPCLSAVDILSDQQWNSSSLATLNTDFAAVIAAIVAGGAGCTITNYVNVSYYSGFINVPYGSPTKYRRTPTLRSGGPVTDVISASAASPFIGSQRRRNRP